MLAVVQISEGVLTTILGIVLLSVIGLGSWIVVSQFSLKEGQATTNAKLDGLEAAVTNLRTDLSEDRGLQANMHQQGRVDLGGERVERVAADASTDNRVEKLRDRVDAQMDAPDEP